MGKSKLNDERTLENPIVVEDEPKVNHMDEILANQKAIMESLVQISKAHSELKLKFDELKAEILLRLRAGKF